MQLIVSSVSGSGRRIVLAYWSGGARLQVLVASAGRRELQEDRMELAAELTAAGLAVEYGCARSAPHLCPPLLARRAGPAS